MMPKIKAKKIEGKTLSELYGDLENDDDILGSAKIWEVSKAAVIDYQKSLNDVRTNLDALAQVTELTQLGFTSEDVSRLATITNIISATTGETGMQSWS